MQSAENAFRDGGGEPFFNYSNLLMFERLLIEAACMTESIAV